MKVLISVGQVYEHEDGEEYEVVKVTKGGVTFETSGDAVVHMDHDELMDHVQEGALSLNENDDNEDDS